MYRKQNKKNNLTFIGISCLVLLIVGAFIFNLAPHARNDVERTANLVGKELAPTDKIEFTYLFEFVERIKQKNSGSFTINSDTFLKK